MKIKRKIIKLSNDIFHIHVKYSDVIVLNEYFHFNTLSNENIQLYNTRLKTCFDFTMNYCNKFFNEANINNYRLTHLKDDANISICGYEKNDLVLLGSIYLVDEALHFNVIKE